MRSALPDRPKLSSLLDLADQLSELRRRPLPGGTLPTAALFWIVGGWLSWCVVRWRQPLPGALPGAVALATNGLNFPDQQNGYVVVFALLLLGLLLWVTYRRSREEAVARQVRLNGDVGW